MNLDNLLPCPRCGWMPVAIGGACTCKPQVDPPTIPILRPVAVSPKPQPRPPAPKPAPHLPNPGRLDTTTAQQLVARLLGRTPA